jgi:hypothetical protein
VLHLWPSQTRTNSINSSKKDLCLLALACHRGHVIGDYGNNLSDNGRREGLPKDLF